MFLFEVLSSDKIMVRLYLFFDIICSDCLQFFVSLCGHVGVICVCIENLLIYIFFFSFLRRMSSFDSDSVDRFRTNIDEMSFNEKHMN